MPKRSSREDPNEAATRILQTATSEEPAERIENVLAELRQRLTEEQLRQLAGAILGQHGGPRGGKARAKKLSAERRKEIAQKAARARWKKDSI